MSTRKHIVETINNFGIPIELSTIIADYGIWSDKERLDHLFNINGGKYIIATSSMVGHPGYLEIKKSDNEISMISCSLDKSSCQHFWLNLTIITHLKNNTFCDLLPFYRTDTDDAWTCNHLIGQIYNAWCDI
jgi:hypothetical protein